MTTESERVEAVRQILIQLYTLEDQGVLWKHLGRIERETIFFLYEHHDLKKWDETRPHSAAARSRRKSIKGRIMSRSHKLTYDHAIPIGTLRRHLKEAIISTETMHSALRRFVCGVIITREEDDLLSASGLRLRMPNGSEDDDRLARYRAVGIKFSAEDEIKLKNSN